MTLFSSKGHDNESKAIVSSQSQAKVKQCVNEQSPSIIMYRTHAFDHFRRRQLEVASIEVKLSVYVCQADRTHTHHNVFWFFQKYYTATWVQDGKEFESCG